MEKDSTGNEVNAGTTPTNKDDSSKEIKDTNKDKEKEKKKRVWSLFGPKKSSRKVFGIPLEELECYENTRLPIIAVQTIEYLKAHGLKSEGLFRIPGSQKHINDMKAEYDNSGGRHGVCPGADVHAVSGLLKQFLRDLPEPLLTYELYPQLIQAQTQREIIGRICSLREKIALLPDANKDVLKYILEFLTLVRQYAENNKMTTANLAIIFGPNLLQPKDADPMKLIEEAHYVNGIIKTLIEEYEFVMNGAEIPLCVLAEEAEWKKRGSRNNKKGGMRAKSDPIRAPHDASNGYKANNLVEREIQSARVEGGMPQVSLPLPSAYRGSIRRKRGFNGEDEDGSERSGENSDGSGIAITDEAVGLVGSNNNQPISEEGREQAGLPQAEPSQERSLKDIGELVLEDAVRLGGTEQAGESPDDGTRPQSAKANDKEQSTLSKRLSWSVAEHNKTTPKQPSSAGANRRSKSCATDPQGPTTASVARMKALIAKVNAEKGTQDIPNHNALETQHGDYLGGMEADDDIYDEEDNEAEIPAQQTDETGHNDGTSSSDDEPNYAPEVVPQSSAAPRKGASFHVDIPPPLGLAGTTSAEVTGGGEPNPTVERTGKRTSRLFSMSKTKPEKEKEKIERKERKREKKEREREEAIAFLLDRLPLWREREKIPEQVPLMNAKQLKAEKKWLKKELKSLDSKMEREELRPLHLRYKEISSYYLERLQKDKSMTVSSSAAIQSCSIPLNRNASSSSPRSNLLRTSSAASSLTSLVSQPLSEQPASSTPSSTSTHFPSHVRRHSVSDSAKRQLRASSSSTLVSNTQTLESAPHTSSPSVPSATPHRAKFAREASADGALCGNGVETPKPNPRSTSFIFRPTTKRSKDRDKDSNVASGRSSGKKARKGSKVIEQNRAVSSPSGEMEQRKRDSSKSSSGCKVEVESKRMSGLEVEAGGLTGTDCSREQPLVKHFEELSIPDNIPV